VYRRVVCAHHSTVTALLRGAPHGLCATGRRRTVTPCSKWSMRRGRLCASESPERDQSRASTASSCARKHSLPTTARGTCTGSELLLRCTQLAGRVTGQACGTMQGVLKRILFQRCWSWHGEESCISAQAMVSLLCRLLGGCHRPRAHPQSQKPQLGTDVWMHMFHSLAVFLSTTDNFALSPQHRYIHAGHGLCGQHSGTACNSHHDSCGNSCS
jgi:hypothetical protein